MDLSFAVHQQQLNRTGSVPHTTGEVGIFVIHIDIACVFAGHVPLVARCSLLVGRGDEVNSADDHLTGMTSVVSHGDDVRIKSKVNRNGNGRSKQSVAFIPHISLH